MRGQFCFPSEEMLTAFRSSWAILHSHQRSTRVSVLCPNTRGGGCLDSHPDGREVNLIYYIRLRLTVQTNQVPSESYPHLLHYTTQKENV